ncbi:MAG: hypothetical protein KDD19_09255 [Phaeodactylibacter sp.]|nr:hypothetical protein [Phaeodactylibacter sp.]MCB9047844.1 hypothetical protein [Lewinellaceae bacterium]
MRKPVYKRYLYCRLRLGRAGAVLLLWGLLAQPLFAGTCEEYSKVIKKEFALSKDGTLALNNKYGGVKVIGWDEPRARLEIRIVVRASEESSAQRVFDRIKIAFNESRDYVSAETEVAQQKREWWFWGEEEADYSISYKAYVPQHCKLIVENRHGDVNIDDMTGPVALKVRYGNFRASQFEMDADVLLEHGMGVIESANRLKASLQQARLRVEDARLVEIDSRYSRIWIENAEEVLSRSRYDTYDLETVGRFLNTGEFDNIEIQKAEEVDVTSTLTELYIERVNKSLQLNVDSSGVKVEAIGRYFNRVDITGNFTDFRLGIEPGTSFQMDAIADFAGIRYPRTMNITYERDAGTNHEVRGHVGPSKVARTIRARVNYGALRVAQY